MFGGFDRGYRVGGERVWATWVAPFFTDKPRLPKLFTFARWWVTPQRAGLDKGGGGVWEGGRGPVVGGAGVFWVGEVGTGGGRRCGWVFRCCHAGPII